jgi:FkbM family methyltransferase
MSSNFIFDIGMHYGLDTEFYLMKGFRVVAVEANPIMVRDASRKFAKYLQLGQLAIENVGVWDTEGDMTFYRNLDKDDWSTFHRELGRRNNTRCEEMTVRCVRIGSLIAKYGVPYYMKIDVEGADKLIVRDLLSLAARPEFISAEEYGVDVIRDMSRLGYDQFQIVPQAEKWRNTAPFPAQEGAYVKRQFCGHDSGLFGLELPRDSWMHFGDAERKFLTSVRDENCRHIGIEGEWYDVHAGYATSLAASLFPVETRWMQFRRWLRPRTRARAIAGAVRAMRS